MSFFINGEDNCKANDKVVDDLIKFRSKGIIGVYGFSICCIKLLFLKYLYSNAENYGIDHNDLIRDGKINQDIVFKLMDKINHPDVDSNLLKNFVPEIIIFVNRDDKKELIDFITNNYEFDYIEVIEKIIEKRGNDKSQIECYLTNKYLFSYVIYLMKQYENKHNECPRDIKDVFLRQIYLPFLGINPHLFTNNKDDYLYNVDFYGGDIDKSIIAMMQMLYILGNRGRKILINEQDSFIDGDTRNDRYSYIYCDTPFTNLKDIDSKYMKNIDKLIDYLNKEEITLNTKNNEILVIENILNKLDYDSLAVICVSDKFLSSDTYGKYRRCLLEKRDDEEDKVYLEAVIQLGCVTYEFKGNTNFLVLSKNRSNIDDDIIKFIDLSDIKFDSKLDLEQAINKTNKPKYYHSEEILYSDSKCNLNFKNLYEDDCVYFDQQENSNSKTSNDIKEEIEIEIKNLEQLLDEFKNM